MQAPDQVIPYFRLPQITLDKILVQLRKEGEKKDLQTILQYANLSKQDLETCISTLDESEDSESLVIACCAYDQEEIFALLLPILLPQLDMFSKAIRTTFSSKSINIAQILIDDKNILFSEEHANQAIHAAASNGWLEGTEILLRKYNAPACWERAITTAGYNRKLACLTWLLDNRPINTFNIQDHIEHLSNTLTLKPGNLDIVRTFLQAINNQENIQLESIIEKLVPQQDWWKEIRPMIDLLKKENEIPICKDWQLKIIEASTAGDVKNLELLLTDSPNIKYQISQGHITESNWKSAS